MWIVSQHEHMSRAYSLLCLLCTLVHFNRTAFGVHTFAKHVSHACSSRTPSTLVFHSGSGAGPCNSIGEDSRSSRRLIQNLQYRSSRLYESDLTEPQTERMNLPQWYGDPSGWREYQQEIRLYKTGENLGVNWSVRSVTGWWLEGRSMMSWSGND